MEKVIILAKTSYLNKIKNIEKTIKNFDKVKVPLINHIMALELSKINNKFILNFGTKPIWSKNEQEKKLSNRYIINIFDRKSK